MSFALPVDARKDHQRLGANRLRRCAERPVTVSLRLPWVFGGFSGWVRLETLDPLTLPDKGDNRLNVLFAKTGDGWHVTKVPVVLWRARLDRHQKGTVAVVGRFVDLREKGGAGVGSTQVEPVTLGTVGLEQLLALRDEFGVLGRRSRLGGIASAGSNQEGNDESPGESSHHDAELSSTPRRNCALMATITVDALIRSAATAGPRVIPAQARAPAASGMATTL